jgi:hypothetical protein
MERLERLNVWKKKKKTLRIFAIRITFTAFGGHGDETAPWRVHV